MWDPEIGLIYQRARYYEPLEGRFLAPDPLGVFAGWNVYRYCFNQPFVFVDPLGLACTKAECDAIHTNIQNRQAHVQQRWNEMHTPTSILPWEGAPPIGQPYPAPHVAADGTPIAAGETSLGSVDTHLRAYEDEQRGLSRQVQRYYAQGCAKHEDATRAASMENAAAWATRSPSLPAYGL